MDGDSSNQKDVSISKILKYIMHNKDSLNFKGNFRVNLRSIEKCRKLLKAFDNPCIYADLIIPL